MFRIALIALATIPLVGGCAKMEQQPGQAAQVPAGQVTGESVSCISTVSIRSTKVYGDDTIDFRMSGKKVYRNVLPQRCYSLGFEERFAYKTTTSMLCSTDTITVLHSDGTQGVTCGLGPFLPMELERR